MVRKLKICPLRHRANVTSPASSQQPRLESDCFHSPPQVLGNSKCIHCIAEKCHHSRTSTMHQEQRPPLQPETKISTAARRAGVLQTRKSLTRSWPPADISQHVQPRHRSICRRCLRLRCVEIVRHTTTTEISAHNCQDLGRKLCSVKLLSLPMTCNVEPLVSSPPEFPSSPSTARCP